MLRSDAVPASWHDSHLEYPLQNLQNGLTPARRCNPRAHRINRESRSANFHAGRATAPAWSSQKSEWGCAAKWCQEFLDLAPPRVPAPRSGAKCRNSRNRPKASLREGRAGDQTGGLVPRFAARNLRTKAKRVRRGGRRESPRQPRESLRRVDYGVPSRFAGLARPASPNFFNFR